MENEKSCYFEVKLRIWVCPACDSANETSMYYSTEKADCKYCGKSFEWGDKHSLFPAELESFYIESCRRKILEQEQAHMGSM